MNHLLPSKEKFAEVEQYLKNQFGNEPWFISVRLAQDDAGKVLDVMVDIELYPKSDPVARIYQNVPVVILKKPVVKKIEITDLLKMEVNTPVS